MQARRSVLWQLVIPSLRGIRLYIKTLLNRIPYETGEKLAICKDRS